MLNEREARLEQREKMVDYHVRERAGQLDKMDLEKRYY